ncbi:MAG: hypothetical protein QF365_05195 [Candidatus Thalassarchaeaceae archaeon]|jgi:hypothetical protein|nr:hypothetical protein [Candidatus Thalassarchaeaceae archaeon]MDP6318517.1 hypothetical protein [Candidatus Thalassarchaeaceae archaeon]DAC36420.1 MAG TPA: hypothetical protein D7H79_00995 [Candidatus Poseidoniales archaeon]HIH79779.1 hypothetical protein [Candidatus Thalassarchaeaceae archaeon]HJM29646.1 hypothetical protein [Candidatus Thalassarchaeaceae archaeon]|tara:strand:- start:1057 stop:1260 length:204 start_codon:yes stop_codon:yes gene_type:complete
MQMMRGLVFGVVSVLPAFFLGALAYFLLGGTSGAEWEHWMWGPCWVLPGLIVGGTFLFGIRDEEDVE